MFTPTFCNRLTLHIVFVAAISHSISAGCAVVGESSDMPYCWAVEHVDIAGNARSACTRADVIEVSLSAVAGVATCVGGRVRSY